MNSGSVLIVDDNIEFLADAMPFLINEMKITVSCAFCKEEAEEKINKYNPGIIILDLGMNGWHKISALKDLSADAPIILITSDSDHDDYIELARELGGDAYCLKSRFQTAFPKLLKYLETGLNFPTYRKGLRLMK